MPCPHGCGDSDRCSQCLGAVPRICAIDEATKQMTIDGAPAGRPFALQPSITMSSYGRRGGATRRKPVGEPDAVADDVDELDDD